MLKGCCLRRGWDQPQMKGCPVSPRTSTLHPSPCLCRDLPWSPPTPHHQCQLKARQDSGQVSGPVSSNCHHLPVSHQLRAAGLSQGPLPALWSGNPLHAVSSANSRITLLVYPSLESPASNSFAPTSENHHVIYSFPFLRCLRFKDTWSPSLCLVWKHR